MNDTTSRLLDGMLLLGDEPVLALQPGWSIGAPGDGDGVFLRSPSSEPAAQVDLLLGRIEGMRRFTSFHRFSPFWTRPAIGVGEAEIAPETLWLLAERGDGRFTMLVPLLDGATRFSLRGDDEGIVVVGETGDPAVACGVGLAVYVATGDDPYAMAASGARAVQQCLAAGRTRRDKAMPDFMHLFGWCTWDAFYKEVSADKVLQGLAAFEHGGVSPRLLVLDDGWQTWQRAATGEDRLTSFAPNERFGGDLAPLVREVKQRFGIQRLLVWHALLGYWGGLDDEAFHDYGARTVPRSFGPGVLAQDPGWNLDPWGAQVGVPAVDRMAAFYDDLHAGLARQGIDGVKVDVQAMLEGVSAGQGGRVATARASRSALEASVARHFEGRLINCMSSTQECAYLCDGSTLMRSSDDFFPQRPESHGLHLFVNALAGIWFGEFIQPDWDMFQSAHERGAFHAAARAISGGPVYVSDKPGAHDFDLLRKLVLSDGSVLLADEPGRLAFDTLFTDPTVQPVLLKIVNRNRDCGVIGLFNAHQPGDDSAPIEGDIGVADVPSLKGSAYAAYAHRDDRTWRCDAGERTALSLAAGEWQIVSLAPIEHGFAAFGLADKFNSTGAVTARRWVDGSCCLSLRDGGHFVAWAETRPSRLEWNGRSMPFSHDAASFRLDVELPKGEGADLLVTWS